VHRVVHHLGSREGLLIEVIHALQGDPNALPQLDGIVEEWVDPQAAIAVAQGRPEADARAEALSDREAAAEAPS
jgi:hypothetical protein